MGKGSKEAKKNGKLVEDNKKNDNKEMGHKRTRSTSKMLTYPGEESPGQRLSKQQKLSRKSSEEDQSRKTDRSKEIAVVKKNVNRRIVFSKEAENSSKTVNETHAINDALPSTSLIRENKNANATTGLLVPDPKMQWIGGVERKLLNKYGPQCSQGTKINTNQVVEMSGDGINLTVEADDLDYVDDVPNPQDPDNERLAEMLEVEEGDDLDDSDGLEKGAAASNIMELPCISKDLSKKQREELLNQNPALRTLLSDLLDDKLKEVIHGGMVTVSRNAGKTVSKRPIGNRVKVQKPARIGKGVSIIKSPSDTTIYTPALKLQNQSLETVKTGKAGEIRQEVLDVGIVNTEQPVQDNITQFLQTMRLESSKGKPMYCDNTDVLFSGVAGDEPEQGTRNENVLPSTSRNVQNTTDVIDQAKDRADKTVLEAEIWVCS